VPLEVGRISSIYYEPPQTSGQRDLRFLASPWVVNALVTVSSKTGGGVYDKSKTSQLYLGWVFSVVLPFSITAQTVGADWPPSPIGKLIDVGGYRVHLYCTGEGGPTVVIVGAGYSFDWGLIQPEVAKFSQGRA
jgi:hypothetical protein